MKSEGYGGRAGNLNDDPMKLLAGVLAEDDVTATGSFSRQCAHPKCERWFIARQDGDIYCSQACDFADNPQFKGSKSYGE